METFLDDLGNRLANHLNDTSPNILVAVPPDRLLEDDVYFPTACAADEWTCACACACVVYACDVRSFFVLVFFFLPTNVTRVHKNHYQKAFGQQDYEASDYLADNIFDLVYPGYRSSGYFKDASQELAPTPFGDVFDVLLSDVAESVLSRYVSL